MFELTGRHPFRVNVGDLFDFYGRLKTRRDRHLPNAANGAEQWVSGARGDNRCPLSNRNHPGGVT